MNVKTTNTILSITPYLVLALTMFMTVVSARREGKSWSDAFAACLEIAKDKQKLEASGYKPEMIDSITETSVAIEDSVNAKAKAEEVLHSESQGIKVGSINGKPIYLGNVLGVGSALAGIFGALRGK